MGESSPRNAAESQRKPLTDALVEWHPRSRHCSNKERSTTKKPPPAKNAPVGLGMNPWFWRERFWLLTRVHKIKIAS